MKNKQTKERFLPGLTAAGVCLLPLSASAMFDLGEAVEVDEELIQILSEVRHEVEVGVGFLSEESFMFGRFSGLTDDGLFLDLHMDLYRRPPHDADTMRYWRLRGRNLGLDSRSLYGEYGNQGRYSAFFDYRQMPHNEWQDVSTWHRGDGSTTLRLPEGTPRDEALLRTIDIQQERRRFTLGGDYILPEIFGRWRISADVTREERDGTRVRGFSGFGIQSDPFLAPELVDYTTEQYNTRIEYLGDRFHSSATYHLSTFAQNSDSWMFAGSPHVDAEWGEDDEDVLHSYALEPENMFHQVSLAGGYVFGGGSRISGDLHIGRMLQDDGFVTALDDGTESLDGEVQTTAMSLHGSHRFTPRLRVRAALRYDDRDNKTDVFEVDGWETRPISTTRTHYSVEGDYRMAARTRLTVGMERDERERDFGHRQETDENTLHGTLRTTVAAGLQGGVRVAASQQSGSVYDRDGVQLPDGLRNYDVADRDRVTTGAFATYIPNFMPALSLSGRVEHTRDDYEKSDFGRTDAARTRAGLEAAWVPTANLTVYGFSALELVEFDLRGETIGGEQWDAEHEDRSISLGIGTEWAFRPNEIDLGVELLWVDTLSRVWTDNGDAIDFPALESTLTRFSLHGDYHVSRDLTLRARYLFEKYSESDWALGTGVDGVDNLVTLGQEERDYSAHMIVGSAVYRF